MSQCAGPIAITAQRCTTFTRYQLRCACGWDRTTDSLGVGDEVRDGVGRLRWAKVAGAVRPSTVVVANVLPRTLHAGAAR